MIAQNGFWHAEDEDPAPEYKEDPIKNMPKKYREELEKVSSIKEGKAALRKYRKFWGIPLPPEISEIEVPGKVGKVLVGLGTTPYAFVADGPKGKSTKVRKIKGPFMAVCDSKGKRLMLIRKSNQHKSWSGPRKLTPIGWAPETHYVPSKDVEAAGSFKRGKYWVHKHDDDGGRWPKVSQDQAGNIIYAGSTLKIGKWMER